jgi:CRP-like cAMP-binding protein
MQSAIEKLDWPSLIEAQPAAGLIPIGLRQQAKRLDAQAHEPLFRIGDSVRCVYLVVSGEARLIRLARNGSEVILQRSRGGFLAEASLEARSYHCDAITTKPTTILMLPVAAFRAALEEDPIFRSAWQSQLTKEIRKLRAQCERLSLNSAADRISHYIESEGADGILTLNQSRKSWAAELGLSHEALYRTLRRMQSEGVLDVDGVRLATK